MINETGSLFIQQTERLTVYQMNFLQAMLDGVSRDFGKAELRERYQLGTYTNVTRIKTALQEKELIELKAQGEAVFADPVFPLWFRRALRARVR